MSGIYTYSIVIFYMGWILWFYVTKHAYTCICIYPFDPYLTTYQTFTWMEHYNSTREGTIAYLGLNDKETGWKGFLQTENTNSLELQCVQTSSQPRKRPPTRSCALILIEQKKKKPGKKMEPLLLLRYFRVRVLERNVMCFCVETSKTGPQNLGGFWMGLNMPNVVMG